jgi:hypothetical protein
MDKRSVSLLFAAACAAASAAAHALPFTDKASVELFAGANAAMGGSFRGDSEPFGLTDADGTAIYDNLKYQDAYDHRVTTGAELDFALTPNVTTFGRFAYSKFDGAQVHVGDFVPSTDGAHTPINAKFDDTATHEFDLGARYTWAEGRRVRPFLGAALGVSHLSATRATVSNDTAFNDTNVELGRAHTVFQQRLETGLQYSPLRNFDLRLTAAASHVNADSSSNDPNLATIGLNNTHGDVRDHWDYPAELGAVWHFD